eukprot:scaffold3875_cov123-Cylindrotheca_fusiformis.AAC.15
MHSVSSLCMTLGALVLIGAMDSANTFSMLPEASTSPARTFALFGAKKKSKKSRAASTGGGFGGASMEACPCGSSLTYASCCGKIHKDVNSFKSASAADIVKARYSAYAKKLPDFLIASTHPLHKDFRNDLKQWKETIKTNMYDNFELPRCIISNEQYEEDDQRASVTFIAELVLRETGEVTAFMETSTFERAKTHGGWLYLNGTIEEVPDELVAGLKKASNAPQVLPSMFMLDDGTARFASVAPHIVVAHSGISADGRVLVAAAQRLAVEHTFTFEEPIPIDLFLEEMSLLLQEYTMKPGSRPFGTTLLVAHLPSVEAEKERQPQLYRIDASGSVTVVVNNVAVLNTRFSVEIESKLLQMVENSKHEPKDENDELKLLCQMLEESILDKEQPGKISLPLSVIGAAFTRKGGLELQKFRSKV